MQRFILYNRRVNYKREKIETLKNRRGSTKLNNAIIVFTRVPEAGKTKTRMIPYYTEEQCKALHEAFLNDIGETVQQTSYDVIVSYTGKDPSFLKQVFGSDAKYIEQTGDNLGDRMKNAIAWALDYGYDKVVLFGTDVPELRAESIDAAFSLLDSSDVVLGPTEDGGYYLIGMKELCEEAFDIKKYGTDSVLSETMKPITESGKQVHLIDSYYDLDEPLDIQGYRERMREDKKLQVSNTGKFISENSKVSIIVPIYNESKTIESMMSQLSPYRSEIEIIFVDGGSTDDTLDKIGEQFKLIKTEKGKGHQMNEGAKVSTGDILFFLHCDSEIPPNIIEEIRSCMVSNQYGCFGIGFHSKNFFMHTNKIISNHRAFTRGIPFGDQGIFIDRKLFFDMGMFPELPLMEDYEFARNLKNKGIMPGKTNGRIYTSCRRYGVGTIDILRAEYKAWNLRCKYRKGISIDELSSEYRDVRQIQKIIIEIEKRINISNLLII